MGADTGPIVCARRAVRTCPAAHPYVGRRPLVRAVTRTRKSAPSLQHTTRHRIQRNRRGAVRGDLARRSCLARHLSGRGTRYRSSDERRARFLFRHRSHGARPSAFREILGDAGPVDRSQLGRGFLTAEWSEHGTQAKNVRHVPVTGRRDTRASIVHPSLAERL
jgi:hypothetical protein